MTKNSKWDMGVHRKFNSTSHTKILSYLKNELIKHPIIRKETAGLIDNKRINKY